MRNVKVNSIGDYIREQREQAKISMRQLAQSAGVSNPYLSQIERGLRKPSADILQQIAKGLRISAEALYVQAGILEDRPADSGVRSALLTDPELSRAAEAGADRDLRVVPPGERGPPKPRSRRRRSRPRRSRSRRAAAQEAAEAEPDLAVEARRRSGLRRSEAVAADGGRGQDQRTGPQYGSRPTLRPRRWPATDQTVPPIR